MVDFRNKGHSGICNHDGYMIASPGAWLEVRVINNSNNNNNQLTCCISQKLSSTSRDLYLGSSRLEYYLIWGGSPRKGPENPAAVQIFLKLVVDITMQVPGHKSYRSTSL